MTPTCVHCGKRDATHADERAAPTCDTCDAEVLEPAVPYVLPQDRTIAARAVRVARGGMTCAEIAEEIAEDGDAVSQALHRAVKRGELRHVPNGTPWPGYEYAAPRARPTAGAALARMRWNP